MDRRYIAAIFVGLLAILVAKMMGPKPDHPADAPIKREPEIVVEKVKVLVAAADLKKEAKLNETAVELKELEKVKDKVPDSALKDPSEVKGMAAAVFIEKGSIVTKEMLKKIPVVDKLSMEIEKGRVAMTIKVDDISSVGGFIAQDDRVDVVGLFDSKSLPYAEPVKTILVGVRVIAVGRDFETAPGAAAPGAPGAPPTPGAPPAGQPGAPGGNKIQAKQFTLVTVAVTREEAEILTLVSDKARFRLLLRSAKEKELTDEEMEREKEAVGAMTRKDALSLSKGEAVDRSPGFGALGAPVPDPFAAAPAAAPAAPDTASAEGALADEDRPKDVQMYKGTGQSVPVTVQVKK